MKTTEIMPDDDKILVSVIVLSYNPDYKKIIATVRSVLLQKGIKVQLIIADDGSKNNYYNAIKKVTETVSQVESIFVPSHANIGTCKNIYRALKYAKGKYIKLISPGDYLYNENTLKNWVCYMCASNLHTCFGETVFYNCESGHLNILKEIRRPQRAELYTVGAFRRKPAVLNYLFLTDAVVGAAFISEKKMLKQYLEMILSEVKFAEDNIYRMMLALGEEINYFPHNVIFYEFGTGISTNRNTKWDAIIWNELTVTNKIIIKKLKVNSVFDLKVKCLLNVPYRSTQYTILKYIIFPSLIFWKIYKQQNIRNTPVKIDSTFYVRINSIDYN